MHNFHMQEAGIDTEVKGARSSHTCSKDFYEFYYDFFASPELGIWNETSNGTIYRISWLLWYTILW